MNLGGHNHSDHSIVFHATVCCPTGSLLPSHGPELLGALASASMWQFPHIVSVWELTIKLHFVGKSSEPCSVRVFSWRMWEEVFFPKLPLTLAQGVSSLSQGRNLKWAHGFSTGQAASVFPTEVLRERKPGWE